MNRDEINLIENILIQLIQGVATESNIQFDLTRSDFELLANTYSHFKELVGDNDADEISN